VVDSSRYEQRRPGRLDHRQWRIEFGGQSVKKYNGTMFNLLYRERVINVKNFHGTMTTVVNAQNDTSK